MSGEKVNDQLNQLKDSQEITSGADYAKKFADNRNIPDHLKYTTESNQKSDITTEIIGDFSEKLALSDLLEIDSFAQKELGDFIEKKSKLVDNNKMLLGPTMDLSMAYIIGSLQGSSNISKKKNLAYRNANDWNAYKKFLKEQGLPIMSSKEMKKISKIGYLSRLEGNPDGKWVAKHFPGGDEKLLLTHTGPVKFGAGNEYVKESLSLFKDIIDSGKSPNGIMMSHASYDISYFPGIEEIINRDKEKYPYLKGISFDTIPASLNPYINSYLRENLGFKGNIIPDWFGGMKAYTNFTDKIKLNFTDDVLAKLAYLSVMTGNTFITGVPLSEAIDLLKQSDIWTKLKKDDPELFKIFVEKAKISVQPIVDKMPNKDWNISIEKLIFLMMCEPEKRIGISEKSDGTINIKYNIGKDNVGDLVKKIGVGEGGSNLAQTIMESGLSQNDVWTRTGVQALIFRQAFISGLHLKITGNVLDLPKYPDKIADEDIWFNTLMKNKLFREYYDKINWEKLSNI